MSGTVWQPFQREVANWLNRWQPSEKHLALIGPSAGYNLPLVQLQRYTCITVFEPDPFACWLFARRVRHSLGRNAPHLQFVREDHLVQHPERLVTFLTSGQPAAVLFCNVLGQLVHLVPAVSHEQRLSAIKAVLKGALSGRSWASFHDRLSGPLAPAIVSCAAPRRYSDAEVLTRMYRPNSDQKPVELVDHDTQGYFPEHLPHSYFSWQLDWRSFHLIEAVQQLR